MAHFTSKDISAISIVAALWAIINALISPIFWQLTHLPFLCDFLAFSSLILVTWATRKLGAASLTGIIATILTLIMRPASIHMLSFIVASIVFDGLTKAIGYDNIFKSNFKGPIVAIIVSFFCACIAGSFIGSIFMSIRALTGILTLAGLHGVGGLIGGILGMIFVKALVIRNVHPIINSANS